ncbi:MAG: MBL fold metallo-hydrolase [Candidatus Hodarchaeales archaeon]|jgi:phosphoribosyl 1,2-cyclic phosphodiesterase
MVVKFQVLASGSNGNCSIISTSNGAILIDCGISKNKLIKLLKSNQVSINSIKAVLLSHFHTDHCYGLPVVSELTNAPLICTRGTLERLRRFERQDSRWRAIRKHALLLTYRENLSISSFNIKSIPIVHDAPGATGFFIKSQKISFSLITDTGRILPEHIAVMKKSEIVLLEMNHQLADLLNSNRPRWLKKRIEKFHLSNEQVLNILKHLEASQLVGLFFGHLSGECNSPANIEDRLVEWAGNKERFPWDCYICKRTEPSPLITLKNWEISESTEPSLNLKDLRKTYTPQIDLLSYFKR